MDSFSRMPPVTANLGQACYKCFKEDDGEVNLQRCTKCRRVSYCSASCQKADWSQHKSICKALHAIETGDATQMILLFSLSDQPVDVEDLNVLTEERAQNELRLCTNILKRPLAVNERNLIAWEPRCMACGRTDRLMRMERNKSQLHESRHPLKPCPGCKFSFFCSSDHQNACIGAHTGSPCEDGHDNLTQCQIQQEIRIDITFDNMMAGAESGVFKWAPERVKPTWTSLRDTNWQNEFAVELASQFGLTAGPRVVMPFVRGASDGLSMPMTIMWALENLNTDDSWTRKETLTIHMLGACEPEILKAQIFEEILHRLPEVKILKLVLCGPELSKYVSPREMNTVITMETCPDCQRRGRRRLHQHHAETYHDLVNRLGNKFIKPDLAVAFNSGISQEAVSSWQPTIGLLVKQNFPSVFTAFNREEAEDEAKILAKAGATLVPELSRRKNIWGSLLTKMEPNKVTGFYAVNGWLAGGF